MSERWEDQLARVERERMERRRVKSEPDQRPIREAPRPYMYTIQQLGMIGPPGVIVSTMDLFDPMPAQEPAEQGRTGAFRWTPFIKSPRMPSG